MAAVIVALKKTRECSRTPTRATYGSVGFDCYTADSLTLKPRERKTVSLGISFAQLPPVVRVELRPRASFTLKKIDVSPGYIDNDYTGEIFALVANNNYYSVTLPRETAIAQLVFGLTTYLHVQMTDSPCIASRPIWRNGLAFGDANSKGDTLEDNFSPDPTLLPVLDPHNANPPPLDTSAIAPLRDLSLITPTHCELDDDSDDSDTTITNTDDNNQ